MGRGRERESKKLNMKEEEMCTTYKGRGPESNNLNVTIINHLGPDFLWKEIKSTVHMHKNIGHCSIILPDATTIFHL